MQVPLLCALAALILAKPCFQQSRDALDDLIFGKEQIVEAIVEAVYRSYSNRCLPNITQDCQDNCAISACASRKPSRNAVCEDRYGSTTVRYGECSYDCNSRKLTINGSTSLLVNSAEENRERSTEECWTRRLKDVFNKNLNNIDQDTLRWQYFGTVNGLFRLYPGFTQEVCYSYDPRVRPWYVAATSGPKNVVLILDASASMLNYGRWDQAVKAATTVVETLTISDFVAVITFSDTAEQLFIDGQQPNTLVQATSGNIASLTTAIKNFTLDARGGTNFEAAFQTAFDVLDQNPLSNSANCHTAILFLTDGYPNRGVTSQQYLIDLIRTRNAQAKAVIFAYTLGSSAGAALARGIACETNGVYKHIEDNGGLVKELSQYYEYYASLRSDGIGNVTWVEPYLDAVGAGYLVTASKSVYDNSTAPPRLVGVVGVDILVSDLEAAGKEAGLDFSNLITVLASRNTCPAINISDCELERIRLQGGGVTCATSSCSVENESTECPGMPPMITYCDYEVQQFELSEEAYREESCCFEDRASNFSIIQCNRGLSAIPLGVAWFLLFASVVILHN